MHRLTTIPKNSCLRILLVTTLACLSRGIVSPTTWQSSRKLELLRISHPLRRITVIRIAVMGYAERRASRNELEEMKELLHDCMRSGAIGLSTGLAYPPGSNADTTEVIELAKVASKYGGIYSSHLRGTDGDFLAGVKEAIEIGESSQYTSPHGSLMRLLRKLHRNSARTRNGY